MPSFEWRTSNLARARAAAAEERDRLWQRWLAVDPKLDAYAALMADPLLAQSAIDPAPVRPPTNSCSTASPTASTKSPASAPTNPLTPNGNAAIIPTPTLTTPGNSVPCHWRTGGPIELAHDGGHGDGSTSVGIAMVQFSRRQRGSRPTSIVSTVEPASASSHASRSLGAT
jgi:hypothetical protein